MNLYRLQSREHEGAALRKSGTGPRMTFLMSSCGSMSRDASRACTRKSWNGLGAGESVITESASPYRNSPRLTKPEHTTTGRTLTTPVGWRQCSSCRSTVIGSGAPVMMITAATVRGSKALRHSVVIDTPLGGR